MMSVLLRRPIEADYEAVASWIPDSKSCARWAGPRVPFPFFAPELPTLLAVPDSESYCLSDGDSPALGFGQLWLRDGDAVRLMRIIVSPAVRGQGFGRELCRQLIARAVDVVGASAVTLAVYRDNVPALSLYRSLGFMPVDARSTDESIFMNMVPGSGGSSG